jgi:hypothetical protein
MQDELQNVSRFNGKLQVHFNLQFVRLNDNAGFVKHSIERSVQVDKELAGQISNAIKSPGAQARVLAVFDQYVADLKNLIRVLPAPDALCRCLNCFLNPESTCQKEHCV